MEHDNEANYYLSREATERELASKDTDPAVSRIHAELADLYARKARAERLKTVLPVSVESPLSKRPHRSSSDRRSNG